jgi:hypothetical protein
MTARVLITAVLVLLTVGCATQAKVADQAAPRKAAVAPEPELTDPKDPLALRTPAQVMRVWIAPWEDSHGDLHAATYLYTEITPQRWSLGLPPPDPVPRLIRPLQIAQRKDGVDAKSAPAKPQAVKPPGGERPKR